MSSSVESTPTNEEDITIIDSIDLHGEHEENEKVVLTEFLSETVRKNKRIRNGVWVTVITGLGKHSTNGPVLRQAVESLLIKRDMIFWPNPDRGSFTVRADSGFELHYENPAQRKDTKVVLRPSDDLTIDLRISSKKKNLKSIEIVFPNRNGQFSLTPAEIAEEERMVSAAKSLSMRETVATKSTFLRESSQIEEALKRSMEYSLETEEEILIKRAIAFSSCTDDEVNFEGKKSLAEENRKLSSTETTKNEGSESDEMEVAIRESLLLSKTEQKTKARRTSSTV